MSSIDRTVAVTIITLLLLLVAASMLVIALVISRRARVEVQKRVNLVATAETSEREETAGATLQVKSGKFGELLRRFFAAGIAHSWGMHAGALMLVLTFVVSAGAGWFLAHSTLKLSWWFAIPLTAAAAFFGPRFILMRQEKQTERKFLDSFPDSVDAAARMLRAGLPITAAVRSISTQAPAPVSTVFAMIADKGEIGVPIEEALDAMSRTLGLSDFRFFAVAVALQRSTGGNLASTLEILSEIIRKRRAVRLRAKALTAEIRVSAYVLGALPFVSAGALLIIQPGYLAPLFSDSRGNLVLMAAGGCLLAAFLTMRQMMRSVSSAT